MGRWVSCGHFKLNIPKMNFWFFLQNLFFHRSSLKMPLLSIHFFQARNLGVVLNSYLLPLIHQKTLLVLPWKYIMILSIFTFPMPPPHPNCHHFLSGLLTWPLNWPVSTLGLFLTPVSTPLPPTTLPLEKLPFVFKMQSKLFPLACPALCDPASAYFPASSCWLCFGHIGHCSKS